MRRHPSRPLEPDDCLKTYVPVLATLVGDLERTSDLPSGVRSQLTMAKIAVRLVQDTFLGVVQERKEIEDRAAEATSALRPADLVNLPEQLREQLQLSRNDHLDMSIYSALESLGGSATLEKLLIELYRSQRKMINRKPLARRLHGLVERGVIFRTPGRRGLYHTSREAALARVKPASKGENALRGQHV